jgi:hypothetical protein
MILEKVMRQRRKNFSPFPADSGYTDGEITRLLKSLRFAWSSVSPVWPPDESLDEAPKPTRQGK